MRQKNIFRTILFLLFGVTLFFVISTGFFAFLYEYSHFLQQKTKIENEEMNAKKKFIKDEVNKVFDFVQFKRGQLRKRLKKSIKRRVYEAHSIARHLYRKYEGKKTGEEIENLVREALRPIRFNNGRGYFFAVNLDGTEELFADRPEFEGKDMRSMRDTKGRWVIKDMIKIVKKKGEGFYTYNWTKPKSKGRGFPKIAFLKLFKPFNWLFGTGEYLDDFERDVKKEVLERIAKIRFGPDNNGYIFVVSYNGVTLMNDTQRHLIGKNSWEMTDPNGIKVIQEERKAVEKPEGDFIQYTWNKPKTGKPEPKLSFVRGIEDWRWMIGAGIYIDDINQKLRQSQKALTERVKNELLTLFAGLFATALLLLAVSFFLTRKLKKQFDIFAEFFNRAAISHSSINLDSIQYTELRKLAAKANNMVEERDRFETALVNERDRAEKANQAKGTFLAVMSHEIRTPLNAIIGMTDLLLDTEMTESQRDYLVTARDSSYHLLSIINDLLNFSKIEANRVSVDMQFFDMGELIMSLQKLFSAPLKEKGILLSVEYDEEPALIETDPVLLKQILINLLGNAVKFTDKGRITIKVSHEHIHTSERNFNLEISIIDTGIGISRDKLDAIFESFEQIDSSISRKFGGTGLGLAISRRMCTLMGGTITVHSTPGEGSTFTVSIPVRYKAGSASPKPGPEVPEKREARNLNILLVEDNAVNARMAQLALNKYGHRITTAPSGEDALEILKEQSFDCILMDIEMPGMNGIETAQQLHENETRSKKVKTPVIAMTAHVLEDVKKQCSKAGFAGFIEKPIRINQINNIILDILDNIPNQH